MAGRYLARGRVGPRTHLSTDNSNAPIKSLQSAAERPSRLRWDARPFALKRIAGPGDSTTSEDEFDFCAALPRRRSSCSASSSRRLSSAISDRYVPAAFLRDRVSARISLRATRAIYLLRRAAMLGIDRLRDWRRTVVTAGR